MSKNTHHIIVTFKSHLAPWWWRSILLSFPVGIKSGVSWPPEISSEGHHMEPLEFHPINSSREKQQHSILGGSPESVILKCDSVFMLIWAYCAMSEGKHLTQKDEVRIREKKQRSFVISVIVTRQPNQVSVLPPSCMPPRGFCTSANKINSIRPWAQNYNWEYRVSL